MTAGWPVEREHADPCSDISCLDCGNTVGHVSCPKGDTTLNPGEVLVCGRCGAAMEIVADGLRLLEAENSKADREERLRYWATQRG